MASPIEFQTFSEFKDTIQPLVAPEDLAEELDGYFREQIGNALSDMQTIIPWLREMNVDFFRKSDVTEFCATSIFQGPVGKISQVFAFKPCEDCKKFYYKRVSMAKIDCWVQQQKCALCEPTDPASINIYESPYCNYVIPGEVGCTSPYLTAAEDDYRFKNLDDDNRVFAVGPDYKIYAAPRFPCDYILCVQWQGIRRKWLDSYRVPVDQQIREAVVNYVEGKIAKKERDRAAFRDYMDEYAINLRTLKFRYHDEMDIAPKRDCSSAIEEIMSAFRPVYNTTYFCSPSTSTDFQQVFSGDSPPATPDRPEYGALWYPTGGGTMMQWSVTLQQWV